MAVFTSSQVFIKKEKCCLTPVTEKLTSSIAGNLSSLTSNIRKNEILRFSVFFEDEHVKIV